MTPYYYECLRELLAPLRVYRTERGTVSGSELYAAGAALDEAADALERAEREGVLPLAEGEGLTRRERLFSHCPASPDTLRRREAIAALERINDDSFTLEAINATLGGCGIRALAEETERTGVIRVSFPDTVGVPEEFERIRRIVLDIIPCHLLTEFFFRFITWAECEERAMTWETAEAEEHTWESFEKAVSA